MTATRRMAIAATAAALLLLAACGSDSEGTKAGTTGSSTTAAGTADTTEAGTTETSAATSETTAAEEATTTTTTEDSEGRDTETSQLDQLADGDHIGHIAGVENGKVEGLDVQVILFDEVQVLTGQEAIDAATADGVALDSDYYVSDPDATLVRLAVAPDASVSTLDGGSPDQVPSSVTDIAAAGEDLLHTINTSTVREVTAVNSIEGYYLA